MLKPITSLLIWICIVSCTQAPSALQPVSLAGEWHFALDSSDIGTSGEWYDLGTLTPGRHVLTVCIDNTYKIPIGNRPSFAFMAMGNESSGTLDELTRIGKASEPRHLYRCEKGNTEETGDFFEIGQRGIVGNNL